jgi:hypothetical protein
MGQYEKTDQHKERASAKNGPARKWPRMIISEMPMTRPQWQRSGNGPLRQIWLGFWAILHSPEIVVPA